MKVEALSGVGLARAAVGILWLLLAAALIIGGLLAIGVAINSLYVVVPVAGLAVVAGVGVLDQHRWGLWLSVLCAAALVGLVAWSWLVVGSNDPVGLLIGAFAAFQGALTLALRFGARRASTAA